MNNRGNRYVALQCESCGEDFRMERYCPVTGHEYNKGWTYVCPGCRSTLREIPDPEEVVCECDRVLKENGCV